MADNVDFYIVILANKQLQDLYRENDFDAVKASIAERLAPLMLSPFEVPSAQPLPSNRVHSAISPAPEPRPIEPLVVPLTVSESDLVALVDRVSVDGDSFFAGGGVNVPFSLADHW